MSPFKPISQIIRERIREAGDKFFSTDNIAKHIRDHEREELLEEVTGQVQSLLESLVIDTQADHNTKDTARRVAKMYLNEVFGGRYVEQPAITTFPNQDYDQIYVTGPISVRSTCAHHFQPFVGKCWIGVYPGDNVIGLSKFNRLVEWYANRPSIQEELTVQIADAVENLTAAKGVAVLIKAEHMCMTMRGVKEHESNFTTSIMRGSFRTMPHMKAEFFEMLKQSNNGV